jgi:uncharacterized protein (TIGR00255 family)
MLRSMTGYGEATVEGPSFALTVEVKSVNNRFLKVIGKIPEEVSFLQNDLEECLRRALTRGSVFLTVRFAPTSYAALYELDPEVLKKYLRGIDALKAELGTDEEVSLKDLFALPGVIRTEDSLQLGKAEVLPLALRATNEALTHLLRMREEEGSRLQEEFRRRASLLSGLVGRVKAVAPAAIQEYREKLEDRLNLLLSQKGVALSAHDILREVALLAERSDISEEIARMESHLAQFVDALECAQAVGRKLEFIVQEMVREANTMGAKSANSTLSQTIVEIKAEVDRLREQVMNVE